MASSASPLRVSTSTTRLLHSYQEQQTFGTTDTFGLQLPGVPRFCSGYPKLILSSVQHVTIEVAVERPCLMFYQCVKVHDNHQHKFYFQSDLRVR